MNVADDRVAAKGRVGLTKGMTMTPEVSLNSGLAWLYLKGNASDKAGNMSWGMDDGGWMSAVERYIGNGNPDYRSEVENLFNDQSRPTPEN